MSKYTTEVRFICEHYAGLDKSEGYSSISEIISKARSKVFDFDYPIFDDSYKSVLETKILRHYYLREIGTETVGVWKHFLEMRLNEIMPYYNKLYNSELIEFNPMYDVDLTTDHKKETTGDSTEDGTNTHNITIGKTGTEATTRNVGDVLTQTGTIQNKGSETTEGSTNTDGSDSKTTTDNNNDKLLKWDVYSDTPQGALTNVANETYLTNARKITEDRTGSTRTSTESGTSSSDTDLSSETTTNSTETRNLKDDRNIAEGIKKNSKEDVTTADTGNSKKTTEMSGIEDYIEHVVGKTGGVSYSKMLEEFRNTFLNIDMLIINNLNDLFFGLW